MTVELLKPDFLRRLEKLHLISRRLVRGSSWGQRRSRNLGSSVEFADYRSYSPGDDVRQIDWPAYGRLGRLFLKMFLDEQEASITLYVDISRSMTFGEPSKGTIACQLAAALGYMSLHHYDRVQVVTFDQQARKSPIFVGKGTAHRLLSTLDQVSFSQEGELNQALTRPQSAPRSPGLSIVLSDFLFPGGYERGLAYLQAAGQQVTVLHLVDIQDCSPQLSGDLRLVDSETESGYEVTINPAVLGEYGRRFALFQRQLRAFCFQRGMGYVEVRTEIPVETTVIGAFRQAGLLR